MTRTAKIIKSSAAGARSKPTVFGKKERTFE